MKLWALQIDVFLIKINKWVSHNNNLLRVPWIIQYHATKNNTWHNINVSILEVKKLCEFKNKQPNKYENYAFLPLSNDTFIKLGFVFFFPFHTERIEIFFFLI